MSNSDINRIKTVGAKSALYNSADNALWQAKLCCEGASKDGRKGMKKYINDAEKYLKFAEECFNAAQEIKD